MSSPRFAINDRRFVSSIVVHLWCVFLCTSVAAGESVDYLRDIKPVLKQRCYACHAALKQESGLRLDTAVAIQKGGDSGPAIVPGSVTESYLLQRVTAEDEYERMPPEGKPLSAEEIAHLKQWIAQGAPHPEDETPEADPLEHWAYQPLVRPEVPAVKDPLWNENPIDAFIAAGHEKLGVEPVPPTDNWNLARRVYLDLTGLPPTVDELRRFVPDERSDAYLRLVDHLLSLPEYGERWARHWMDVWRYSDWFGLNGDVRYSQKHIWHWRDWIIESLNADKGYDQMILEMLAADELYPTNHKALRATGFLVRNYFLFNRTKWLDETIEHTAKAFLGITANCAKCHDHKYDPISQVDYYRLRALFEPYHVRLDPLPGVTDLEVDALPRTFDAHLDVPTYLFIRGNEMDPDKDTVIEPGIPQFLASDDFSITPVSLPLEAHLPILQDFAINDLLSAAEKRITEAKNDLEKAESQLVEITSSSKSTAELESAAGEVAGHLFFDDFETFREDSWQPGPGDWRVDDERLIQQRVSGSRSSIRTRATFPEDFRIVLKLRMTGGEIWRNVGIAFDVVGKREKLVYFSAATFGPRVQIAYKMNGYHVEPPAAGNGIPDRVNRKYEVVVAVRGQLVNVYVDGDFEVAYELPVPRESGHIELVTYDASAKFDRIEVHPLSTDEGLVRANGFPVRPSDLEQAQASVAAIKEELSSAKARKRAIQAVYAAEVAKHQQPPRQDLTELVQHATQASRALKLAEATATVARAEYQLLSASDDKKENAQEELDVANNELSSLKERLQESSDTYDPIRTSLKGLERMDEPEEERHKPYPSTSTGRRTALARWIVHPQNPLAARVAVNHIWVRHFGQPLVQPVTDFGRQTKRPVQKDLLDWLAAELIANNWRMKPLHRLIVTSQAYRLSSSMAGADASKRLDPQNQYLWRRVPMRMESEVIRDALLSLSGELESHLGGPALNPHFDDGARRSLYFSHSRDDVHEFLNMFDRANVTGCYRRSASIIPQQALAMVNGRLSLEMARVLTNRIHDQLEDPTDEQFIRTAYQTILNRPVRETEFSVCSEALHELRAIAEGQSHPRSKRKAREHLVHALFNHNDFVTIR